MYSVVSNAKTPLILPEMYPSEGIIQEGLIGWYRCNEGKGQRLNDLSYFKNHGQLGSATGADASDPSWANTGIVFSGTTYVTVGAVSGVGAGIAAAQFVFYNNNIISKGMTAEIPLEFQSSRILLFGPGIGDISNEIITLLTGDSGGSYWADATASIAVGWHIMDIHWHGSGYQIFIDGAEKNVSSYNVPALMPAGAFRIGLRSAGSAGFSGSMAYLLLYNKSPGISGLKENRKVIKHELSQRGISLTI